MPIDKEDAIKAFITNFVKKHSVGPRAKTLEKECVPEYWSSRSTFHNFLRRLCHRKILDEKVDQKMFGDRYPRYYVVDEEEGKKAAFKKQVEEQRLIPFPIDAFPIDERDKLVSLRDLNEHYRNRFIKMKGVKSALKLILKSREDTMFFLNHWINIQAKEDFQKFKIDVAFSKNTPPIKLEKDQIDRLLQVMALSGLGRKEPYKIILSYDPDSKRTEKERTRDQLAGFSEWLKKFRGKEIDYDLVPYLIDEKTLDKEPLKPEKIVKLNEYMEYFIEFINKYHECDEMLLSKK